MEVYKIFQSQDFKTLDFSKESDPNVYQYNRCKKMGLFFMTELPDSQVLLSHVPSNGSFVPSV